MKKRFEEWLKLTSDGKPVASTSTSAPIRILDLPGFHEMEDKLLIYRPRRGEMSPELGRMINELSEKTFGITENDTLFEVPERYWNLPEWSEEKCVIDDRYNDHEDQFETADATDDEAVAVLLRLGLDFQNTHGNPLLCTKLFCRQAEAASKGIMGKMPDRVAANLESWTKKIEHEARQHMNKKRAG